MLWRIRNYRKTNRPAAAAILAALEPISRVIPSASSTWYGSGPTPENRCGQISVTGNHDGGATYAIDTHG
jgi:hypothetical protein